MAGSRGEGFAAGQDLAQSQFELKTVFRQLTNFRETLNGWARAARSNAANARQARTLPTWLAAGIVLFDFFLIGLGFRFTQEMSIVESSLVAVFLYLVRLSIVTATLLLARRHYRVSTGALGICPSKLLSDFRWSARICLVGASIIFAAIVAGFVIARGFSIRLPAPPQSVVQVLDGGSYSVAQFVAIALLAGAVVILLAPVTEELVYRSVLLPALACRVGLFPAIAVSAFIFGLAHVIPSGQFWIPIPEIIGGLLMAAGFAIRWSVIPAMVIHAMGNLVSSSLVFIYVQLFRAYPTWFGNQ